jgi:hypothetical protein
MVSTQSPFSKQHSAIKDDWLSPIYILKNNNDYKNLNWKLLIITTELIGIS